MATVTRNRGGLGPSTRIAVFLFAVACSGQPELLWPGELSDRAVGLGEGERSVAFTGDIMLGDWAAPFLGAFGVGYPFRATLPLLRSADIAVGNLEGPVARSAEKQPGRYRYKVPPWTLEGLKVAGFDLLSLANNHLYDCGEAGLRETLGELRKAGIPYFGAGASIGEGSAPKVLGLGRLRIAFVGAVAGETWFHEFPDSKKKGAYEKQEAGMIRAYEAGERRAGTVVARRSRLVAMVQEARARADIVAVVVHFGIRYHRPPTAFQRELGRAAIDAGADIVIGHHAHFWQPVELYRGKPIAYGIGNFAFGSFNSRVDAGLVVRAVLGQDRLKRLEIFPLYIRNTDTRVLFQPKIMKGAFAQGGLRSLREQSAALGAEMRIADGRAILEL